MAQYVAHNGAVDGRVLGRCEEKSRVYAGHLPVDLGYGALKLKISRCAQPSYDVAASALFSKVDGQPVVCLHAHLGAVCEYSLDEVDTPLGGEHASLLGINANGDHYLVENLKPAKHYALMPDGERVE